MVTVAGPVVADALAVSVKVLVVVVLAGLNPAVTPSASRGRQAHTAREASHCVTLAGVTVNRAGPIRSLCGRSQSWARRQRVKNWRYSANGSPDWRRSPSDSRCESPSRFSCRMGIIGAVRSGEHTVWWPHRGSSCSRRGIHVHVAQGSRRRRCTNCRPYSPRLELQEVSAACAILVFCQACNKRDSDCLGARRPSGSPGPECPP